jgi:hypothetical protein
MLNEALRHEDVVRSGSINLRILNVGNRCGQLCIGVRVGPRVDLVVVVVSGGGLIYNSASKWIVQKGEARHRKYKKLKLGGGQAYDRSSD